MKNRPLSQKEFIQSEINYLNLQEDGYQDVLQLSDGKHTFEELYDLLKSNRGVRKTKHVKMFPKGISKNQSGYYTVNLYSKKYKQKHYVGTFSTIEEAIKARDIFVIKNYLDIMEGFLPRGISKVRKGFRASFSFFGGFTYIGQYDSLKEAIEKRNEFIESLK